MVPLVTGLARHLALIGTAALALLLASGCARAPDEVQLRDAIQQQLDAALGGRVLTVQSLTPAGSAALDNGRSRLKYFNARLELARDYDFTNWNAHSVASLASLLGAGPKGVSGLKPGGNHAGDILGVYGSAAFEQRGGRWELLPAAQPAAGQTRAVPAAAVASVVQPRPHEVPPPSPAQAAYARLGELLVLPAPGVTAADRETILREAFERAYGDARRRLEQRAGEITVAGGPSRGAYEQTLEALAARAQAAGIALSTLPTEGSVGNIRLLVDGSVAFALVQSDIAHSAYLGRDRFAGAPQTGLRAVASLFPETIQLVARAGAGIASPADLRGKRVGIGPAASGTRANALAVLAANGLAEDALAAVFTGALPEAAQALATGTIDAFFVTVHAPAPPLTRLAASVPVTWVPIGPSRELVSAGLVAITMPARTYPRQDTPIPTLAATALLITRADVPSAQVEQVLSLLFLGVHAIDSAAVSRISIRTAREGVNLPWSPVAERWFAEHEARLGTTAKRGPGT